MKKRCVPWRIAILLTLTAGVAAQDPGRDKVAGRVVDAQDRGVAQAQVTLVHRPIGWCADYGEVDVVRTVADDAGRFQAALLPLRPYSAFATWGTATVPVVSMSLEHVAAGAFVTLRQQQTAIVDVRVRVDGQEAWKQFGPLRFRIVPMLANLWPIELRTDDDGSIRLPPLPTISGVFEVATADGQALWGSWIARTHRERQGLDGADGSTLGLQVFRLPPPVEVPVQVVSAESGKPVAGASLRLRSNWYTFGVAAPKLDAVTYLRDAWRSVGTTDAQGLATAIVPAECRPWEAGCTAHVCFAVRAEGFAEAYAGWAGGAAFWDRQEQAERSELLRVPLQPQRAVTGRLTYDGTVPAAGRSVLLWMQCQVAGKLATSIWGAPSQRATTDADGRFAFPFAPRGRSRILVGVPLEREPQARAQWIDGAPPMLLAMPFGERGVARASVEPELDRDLGDAVLGGKDTVTVRLVDRHGNPVRSAEVYLLHPGHSSEMIAVHNTTDGTGRCVLFPAGAGQLIVAVVPDQGYVMQAIGDERAVVVELAPFAEFDGRLVANDGAPVEAGALRVGAIRPGTVDRREQPEQARQEIAASINRQVAFAISDATGRFRIPYVPIAGQTLHMWATVRHGTEQRSARFDLACDRDPATPAIEVRLGR